MGEIQHKPQDSSKIALGSNLKEKRDKEVKGANVEQDEYAEELKPQSKTDYSGAHEKTDPREIALVKKLDRWIMVCPYMSLRS